MKMSKLGMLLIILGLLVMCSSTETGQDWPQWRGANRDGLSAETGLLAKWPANGPKLVWQVTDLGEGYSTPAVVQNRIYIMTSDTLNNEYVKELDAVDGKTIWSSRVGAVGKPDQRPSFPGARSTPTVENGFIYALSSDGDMVCLEKISGKIIWQKNIVSLYNGESGTWAYSESPLIDGEKVLVTPGGPDASVIALNKTTGDLIWKVAIPGCKSAGYASMVIAEGMGIKQYITMVDTGLAGINVDGTLSWLNGVIKGNGTIGTPITRDEYVYAGSRNGCSAIKLSLSDDKVVAESLYLNSKLPNEIGGSVLVGDYLYGSKSKNLICADFLTGEIQWKEKLSDNVSLCYADSKLYLHGYNGEVAMIEASPEAYKELGRFAPTNQPAHTKPMDSVWTYPIISNGKLYIRDGNSLWCYSIK
ncbi:PQQ-like beta-propeller repeat protein [bacterium]|nr:PQQ-like beta-propeller repeat protein [bacterium]